MTAPTTLNTRGTKQQMQPPLTANLHARVGNHANGVGHVNRIGNPIGKLVGAEIDPEVGINRGRDPVIGTTHASIAANTSGLSPMRERMKKIVFGTKHARDIERNGYATRWRSNMFPSTNFLMMKMMHDGEGSATSDWIAIKGKQVNKLEPIKREKHIFALAINMQLYLLLLQTRPITKQSYNTTNYKNNQQQQARQSFQTQGQQEISSKTAQTYAGRRR